jgi:alpha-amylase/alpha-mannosidase (GH57 family)
MTALIVHGHFYQPPRENPWTGKVGVEPSAAPYHDWNERIHSECYGPNAFAHIGNDSPVINNYRNISFNFGPTLLTWLDEHQQRTYQRILAADRESAELHEGHGNAIAQAYGHAILPLCNARDRLTQVRWGLEDFRFRFGRQPESLWLPETACNNETLSLLIDEGLRFVILAPEQAGRVRPNRIEPWIPLHHGEVDTTRPYRYKHMDGSGQEIAIFFYHGGLARAIAFERALSSSSILVGRFVEVGRHSGHLVNTATDGETYGHHFKFGDLCLAYALQVDAKSLGLWVTNYGQYLDHHPPQWEAELNLGPLGEGTSWSCAHGVGRWTRDCGCLTGGESGWNQKWRGPLRLALDFLRDAAAVDFENAGGELFQDPWLARNEYIKVMLNPNLISEFIRSQQRHGLSVDEELRARTLLEAQRNSLLMFTSCGWFFSDLAGIETVQILKYASRLMELQDALGFTVPRKHFLEMLAEASSNNVTKGNGAEIFLKYAQADSPPVVPGPAVTN